MTSKKRSAQKKQIEVFKSQLGGMDDLFEREKAHQAEQKQQHEAALRRKGCESKNRYHSHAEAEAAKASCEERGVCGLEVYRCTYCNGWHLTSHPWRD